MSFTVCCVYCMTSQHSTCPCCSSAVACKAARRTPPRENHVTLEELDLVPFWRLYDEQALASLLSGMNPASILQSSHAFLPYGYTAS